MTGTKSKVILKIIPTEKPSDYRVKPLLVKALFQQAYVDMFEAFRPKKRQFREFPLLNIGIDEIEAHAKEKISGEVINFLNREAFKAAGLEMGMNDILGEGK